ncbi:MAG: creatininase family protein [Acidobacteria bacterium]|nr:creatininase family protein [Acidobacteriota bacterium]
MKRLAIGVTLIFVCSFPTYTQAPPPMDPPDAFYSKNAPKDLVEFGMMTWPEVYRAIHSEGKTTALFYTGGTEHRGPQNVDGGHNLMAIETVIDIARKLGNALVMPILPYSSNNASRQQTGTLGLTEEIQALIMERLAEQAIVNGFTNVMFLNDHGGGVRGYGEVAKKLDDKYRAPEFADKKIHVYYIDRVYGPAQNDFNKMLGERGLPNSGHAVIADTSEMMYLEKGRNWVRRDLLPTAVANAGRGATPPVDPSVRVVSNGISGDARQSSEALGKIAYEMKVNYAVEQIKKLLAGQQ